MKIIRPSFLLIVLLQLVLFISCKKKFDLPPPVPPLPSSGSITIDSLIRKYGDYYVTGGVVPTKFFKFSNDATITCTVTADETSGNIYKTVYVQDPTGCLQVKLINSGGLFVGDYIKINLNGLILDDYAKVIQLDSVDIEKHVNKISTGNPVVPLKVTFNEMQKLNSFGLLKHQSQLIMLDSVEFSAGDKNTLFADPVGKYSVDHSLENDIGNTITVRTSGYAKFAGSIVPCGKGSIVAVLGQYNTTYQLIIRDFSEVKMSSGACPIMVEPFNSLSSWINFNETGNVSWTLGNYNGSYAQASNYVGGHNNACRTWLISPPLDISAAPAPKLSFITAYNYTGPALEVYVSTNYTQGDPTVATWTKLNPFLSLGSWQWQGSGKLPLTAYKSPATRVAFIYSGSASDGSTWELDNVAILAE